MNKKILFIILLFSPLFVIAQRVGYVDTEFILTNIPEYNAALEQIERQSKNWQKDIDLRYQDLQKVIGNYETEKLLLSESARKKIIEDIEKKEKSLEQLQYIRFGPKGELFKMKAKLLEPIQQKVASAIREIASKENYDMVLDKGKDLIFLYVNSNYDISELVVNKLGYKLPETDD